MSSSSAQPLKLVLCAGMLYQDYAIKATPLHPDIEAGGFNTLVAVSNVTDGCAGFISTLEVMSDDLIENRTSVTCGAGGSQKKS